MSNIEFDTREQMSFSGLDVVSVHDKWQFKFFHQIGDARSPVCHALYAGWLLVKAAKAAFSCGFASRPNSAGPPS